MTSTARRPAHVGHVTGSALEILQRYTMFPWPLLKTQAERRGLDAANLDANGLAGCLDDLHAGLVRFTNPEKGAQAIAELRALIAGLK